MNEVKENYDKLKLNLTPLHFTMSKTQYYNLQKLKKEGFCKIMYILRYTACYIVKREENIKSYKDNDFSTKTGKHYKVDLPNEIYNDIERIAENKRLSMSKVMRIGLNDVLNFYN